MSHPDDPQRPTDSAPLRLVLAGVLALLLVVSLIWLVVGIVDKKPFQGDDGPSATEVQLDREAAMEQAEKFVALNFSYARKDVGADGTMADYRSRLEPLMTTKAQEKLDQWEQGLVQLITKEGFASKAEASASGVQAIDEDTADVIVSGTFETKRQGKDLQPTFFQLLVTLKHVDGDWLVDDYGPIEGEELP